MTSPDSLPLATNEWDSAAGEYFANYYWPMIKLAQKGGVCLHRLEEPVVGMVIGGWVNLLRVPHDPLERFKVVMKRDGYGKMLSVPSGARVLLELFAPGNVRTTPEQQPLVEVMTERRLVMTSCFGNHAHCTRSLTPEGRRRLKLLTSEAVSG